MKIVVLVVVVVRIGDKSPYKDLKRMRQSASSRCCCST